MDAVIGTNVVVSGIIHAHGSSAVALQMVLSGELTPVFDDRIVQEYETVLKREKFSFPTPVVDRFMAAFKTLGRPVIAPRSKIKLPDENDRCFYECALMAKSNILVTGNARHFPKDACSGIRVLSPREFLEI